MLQRWVRIGSLQPVLKNFVPRELFMNQQNGQCHVYHVLQGEMFADTLRHFIHF